MCYAMSQSHIVVRILDTWHCVATVTMSSSKCAVTYKECFKYLGERYAKGTSENRKRSIRKFTTGRVTAENGILYYCENGQEKRKRQ